MLHTIHKMVNVGMIYCSFTNIESVKWWLNTNKNDDSTMWNILIFQSPRGPRGPMGSWFWRCRLSTRLSRSSICASTTVLSRASSAWYTAVSCSCSWKFLATPRNQPKMLVLTHQTGKNYKNRECTKETNETVTRPKKKVVRNRNQNLTQINQQKRWWTNHHDLSFRIKPWNSIRHLFLNFRTLCLNRFSRACTS